MSGKDDADWCMLLPIPLHVTVLYCIGRFLDEVFVSRHRFHGDPERFAMLADFVADRYWHTITYIADVAGGQGMLTRVLTKKYHYDCEVVDPRMHVLKGVKSQVREFDATLAPYYDLIIGLHPDQATRAVAQAALVRPTILVPCCNFWSEEKLGQEALLQAIEQYYREQGVLFERVQFPFKGPKNIGLVSEPPSQREQGRSAAEG